MKRFSPAVLAPYGIPLNVKILFRVYPLTLPEEVSATAFDTDAVILFSPSLWLLPANVFAGSTSSSPAADVTRPMFFKKSSSIITHDFTF